jgi:hypothetical protein
LPNISHEYLPSTTSGSTRSVTSSRPGALCQTDDDDLLAPDDYTHAYLPFGARITVPEREICGGGTSVAMSLEPGHGPSASNPREVTRRRTGDGARSLFWRWARVLVACTKRHVVAAHDNAQDTARRTTLTQCRVSAHGAVVADDGCRIVNVWARPHRQRDSSSAARRRLRKPVSGRARQRQHPPGRAMDTVPSTVHDPHRRVELSRSGRCDLSRVQSRSTARHSPSLQTEWANTRPSSRRLPGAPLPGFQDRSITASHRRASHSATASAITADRSRYPRLRSGNMRPRLTAWLVSR